MITQGRAASHAAPRTAATASEQLLSGLGHAPFPDAVAAKARPLIDTLALP